MKYIKVKEDVKFELEQDGVKTKHVWSFYRYLKEVVVTDHSMGFGYRALKLGVSIKNKFHGVEVGTWVELRDSQYDMIKTAVTQPKSLTKEREILELFIPFMDAIVEEAQDTNPDDVSK